MICKVCGYESDGNFSVCPYCGDEISSQNQIQFPNQNQYPQEPLNQNNQYNQSNQYNPSQYQTPFTKPHPQSNQYQQNNQYNPDNHYSNNYNQVQTNNYTQNQSNYSSTAVRKHKGYSSSMPDYFRGFGRSFEINQNELKMSRLVNAGEFAIWALIVGIISCVLWFFIMFSVADNFDKGTFELIFTAIFFIGFLFLHIFKYAIFTVNSSGIIVKTIFKQYFIPREKIDSIVCRTVERRKGRYGRESFYDVFIIMKDKSVFNKIDIDTGLCYKNKIHVDYLIDMFNERLGFL